MGSGLQADEAKLCEAFFEAARSGGDGEALRRALAPLAPLVRRTVRARVGKWSRLHDLALEAEDVEQEVLIKLLKSPPERKPQDTPRATLLAWLKTVTNNLLVDQRRRVTRKTEDRTRVERIDRGVELERLAESDDRGTGREIRRFHAAREIDENLRYLEQAYPAGARYVAAMRDNPGATGNELAALLGVSRANYDQIARRTRIVVRNRLERPSREQK